MNETIPARFIWTRMNTDGGEPLDNILRRKDLERRSGEGEFENTFWWGVGESKGQAIWTWLVESGDDKPPILFSEALGEAKPEDKRPKSCLLWRTYQTRDASGRYGVERPVPGHIIVKSGEKKIYYAIVCHARRELETSGAVELYTSQMRNLKKTGR